MGIKINLYQHQNNLLVNSFDDVTLKLLQKRRSSKIKSLLFCGSEPGVGTTTIAINLAMSLAQGKNKTLLIDADMRKTARHKRLSETPPFGLSDFLEDKTTITEIINQTNIDYLHYITCGTPSNQSAKLLRLLSLDKLVSTLSATYDFILFDSPSLDVVNDGVVLSILVDGIFIVSELGRTTKSNIRKVILNLSDSRDKIQGILINKVNQLEYRMYIRNYDYFQRKRA